MIAEPDVALTDFGLAVEAALMTLFVSSAGRARVRSWWILFFGATALGALLGGIVHGFFANSSSAAAVTLWRLTLVMIGLTALAAWGVGANTWTRPAVARWIVRAAIAEFFVYGFVVFEVADSFAVAIIGYLPAALFLLVALVRVYRHTAALPVFAGVIGLVVLCLGSWVQWSRIDVHPVYFTHNAVYHAVEAIALLGLYRSARWMVASARPRLRC